MIKKHNNKTLRDVMLLHCLEIMINLLFLILFRFVLNNNKIINCIFKRIHVYKERKLIMNHNIESKNVTL